MKGSVSEARDCGVGGSGWGGRSSEGRPHFHLSVSRSICPGGHPCAHAHKRAGANPRREDRVRRRGEGVGGSRAQARGRAGAQWCGWCVGANPGRQTQRKEPSVLTQRALMQRGAAGWTSSHSLMSGEGGRRSAATQGWELGRSVPWPLRLLGLRDAGAEPPG